MVSFPYLTVLLKKIYRLIYDRCFLSKIYVYLTYTFVLFYIKYVYHWFALDSTDMLTICIISLYKCSLFFVIYDYFHS